MYRPDSTAGQQQTLPLSTLFLLTIFIRPPRSRQTDRQTDKIQLTNTTNTKLKAKVTKCQIIHAIHFLPLCLTSEPLTASLVIIIIIIIIIYYATKAAQ